MLYKPDETKVGLVRGYVVYADRTTGLIGLDVAKKDDQGCHVAYTFWHRHDEDPAIVSGELRRLHNCVTSFRDCSCSMVGFEYKDYRRN